MEDLAIEEMFKIAISLRDDGKLNQAIDVFKRIISIHEYHPKLSGVFIALAGVYDDLEDYRNSEQYFKQATKLNPQSELASLGLYLSLVKTGDFGDAIDELKDTWIHIQPICIKTHLRN